MNKAELVEKIASTAEITKADAKVALDCLLDCVKKTLKKGGSVVLTGFGTFAVTARKKRTGINPITKKPMVIPARKVAKFKPGKELKEAIN